MLRLPQLAGKRPSGPMIVSTMALVVALGGTSYAAATIGSGDIRNGAVSSPKIKDNTIRSIDVRDGGIRARDLAPGARQAGSQGPAGTDGQDGATGPQGPAGIGRWLLVDRFGAIVAQSGGFEIKSGYDLVNNTGTQVPLGATGNVYIESNEDLSNNGITATIALQNQFNQDANPVNTGRNDGPDANPEFSGEITATVCGITGVVACAPTGTNTREYLVVSPRNSDGSVTTSGTATSPNTHKRFYVIITGDSSDFVAPTPAIPPMAIAPNPAP